jgi:hypothetical protein
MPFATIAEAIAYVEGFAARPPDARDTLPPRERQAARLPQMRALLALLGDPQDGLRVAHVTGTSGKGSTATMLVPEPISFAQNARLCFNYGSAKLCFLSLQTKLP